MRGQSDGDNRKTLGRLSWRPLSFRTKRAMFACWPATDVSTVDEIIGLDRKPRPHGQNVANDPTRMTLFRSC